jgi:hypothetical protein
MTLIFKGLLYNTSTFAFAGGLAVGVPTARGYNTTVVDFLGDVHDFDSQARRVRSFDVANETWSLSPFIAFLAKPTERLFFQGFVQYDQPLNASRITYSQIVDPNAEPAHVPGTPISATDSIREQSLLHIDLGVGGWLFRDPQREWLTGIAPTVELHYTTTTSNADIITLPSNTFFRAPDGSVQPEPAPQVGNQRNRVDILDLTLGTTFVFADRATLAAGITLPLRTGDNRTFDYELQLQLNYYFGGPNRTRTPTIQ